MPNVTGYPFNKWMLSKKLADDEYTAAFNATTLSGLTLSSSNVLTVGSESIQLHELKYSVQSIDDNQSWSEIDVTSIGHSSKAYLRGRLEFSITGKMFINYDTDSTYDLVVKDSDGARILLLERETGRKLVCLVQIFEVKTSFSTDGMAAIDFTMKRSGGPDPSWE